MNFRYINEKEFSISIGETITNDDVQKIISICAFLTNKTNVNTTFGSDLRINSSDLRTDKILTHPTFNSHHSESQMMRYLKRLENKDLSLVHSMIPLGSCTM